MAAAVMIQDFDDPSFDPFVVVEKVARQGQVSNTYEELGRLRRIKPVWDLDPRLHFGTEPDQTMVGRRKWTVLGHAEVSKVLTDPALFSSKINEVHVSLMFGRSITAMDGPEHRKYRMIFQKIFAPDALGGWKEHVVPKVIDRLIDKLEPHGRADLVHEFALHFPFQFVSELLRLPEHSRSIFHKLAFAQTAVRYDKPHALEAGEKLGAYLTALVRQRREEATDPEDLVQTLSATTIDGERLPEIVLISFLRQLMNAAGDTSFHGFSNLMAGLLTHPDQLEHIRNDRTLVGAAIEEGLRWEPPVVFFERTTTQEVDLAGALIQPGDDILVGIGPANRDETVYERPDEFDIFRKKQRHLAFGGGAHICIGQHLARVEMTVALNALLDRLPKLRLDPDRPPPTIYGVSPRRPKGVHVLFG